jgi:DNA-binding winged helix-turn-helix (wHTH) protein
MTKMEFDAGALQVTIAGEAVRLLPKEYALLEFLYRNRNQAFSREDLLNRIWPLEDPVDRTVDDHVYRLRKKLKKCDYLFRFDSVRGIGYRLTWKEAPAASNPLASDPEYLEHVRSVFEKYQQFGQGGSMKMLAETQKNLGIENIPFYSQYVRIVRGEFGWLAETDDVSFWEKAYSLILTHFYMHFDTELSLSYMERALELMQMPDFYHREMYILNILDPYCLTGRTEQAIQRLKITHATLKEAQGQLEPFETPVAISEAQVYLFAGDVAETERKLARAAELLQKHPYLRERGSFAIVFGQFDLLRGRRQDGARRIAEGLEILRESQFVVMEVRSVRLLVDFLRHHVDEPDLLNKYERKWEELARDYRFAEVEPKMRRAIENGLGL